MGGQSVKVFEREREGAGGWESKESGVCRDGVFGHEQLESPPLFLLRVKYY